jgi:heterodisulfide reductase subunit A
MAGIVCNKANHSLASAVQMPVDDDGFFRSRDNIAAITESDRDGIFFAGTCTGPKTIPETLAEARSAALNVYNYLKKGK